MGTVLKRYPLLVVSLVFQELQALPLVQQKPYEQFNDLEMRFGAQLSKCKALGKSVVFSSSIAALILRANADVDYSQRISILTAATRSKRTLTTASITDYFIRTVSYQTIASVLHNCDKPAVSQHNNMVQYNLIP